MTKPKELKVGDRVMRKPSNSIWKGSGPPVGNHGTVIEDPHYPGIAVIAVRWDNWSGGWDGGCWAYERSDLRKLPDRKEGA